ncbi:hypothetical protein SAY86_019851 [Trapa natans]|uniref:Uncharacterized protein n=1 Tax=Trapa natans TaxID=22666 RepID=A0AAN7LLJ0_TRANT|nr:hypothetical protein SAY86_019851 [Trapa natans]
MMQNEQNLRFNFVTNALVQDITTLNTKVFHVMVFGTKNITFRSIKIITPKDSPNTDGIQIGHSSAITTVDASIETGDDCVCIGDGSEQVTITSVTCELGHGISIGSLEKYNNELPVNGIFVKKSTLTNTLTGVRIKSWPASLPGVANNVHFEDITMNNVSDLVLIDQGYCQWNQCTIE